MRRSLGVITLCALSVSALFSLQLRPNFSPAHQIFALFGAAKKLPTGWVLHKQSQDLDKIDLKVAEKPCANWAWVAGIVALAQVQGARMDQQYLVDRLYGGSVCVRSAGDMGDLAQRISRDYVLADGQSFRLTAHFTPGAPSQADPLILSIRQGVPLMVVWRDHAYVLTGLDYDEYVAPTGNKIFIITELRLFDPAAEGEKSVAKFVRERDNPDDLTGILDLTINPK